MINIYTLLRWILRAIVICHSIDTVGFGMGEYYNYFKEGDFVDVAFGLSINDYKGFHNVQLILKDIKLSEVNN